LKNLRERHLVYGFTTVSAYFAYESDIPDRLDPFIQNGDGRMTAVAIAFTGILGNTHDGRRIKSLLNENRSAALEKNELSWVDLEHYIPGVACEYPETHGLLALRIMKEKPDDVKMKIIDKIFSLQRFNLYQYLGILSCTAILMLCGNILSPRSKVILKLHSWRGR